jgi:SAM-dependent methyltransferase
MQNDKPPLAIPLGSVDWGTLRRQEPISNRWGFDRGQPIDRYYIENFLARHADDIRGHCLELMNADYTHGFGKERITQADVLDINPRNPKATIVGDLLDPATLAPATYDCIILTQTLQVLFHPGLALRHCSSALRPGGVLLVTVPCFCRYSPHPVDYWRFTASSLSRLIEENTDDDADDVASYGNLIASIGFLQGMATSELQPEELDLQDDRFPIVATARLRKPQAV